MVFEKSKTNHPAGKALGQEEPGETKKNLSGLGGSQPTFELWPEGMAIPEDEKRLQGAVRNL